MYLLALRPRDCRDDSYHHIPTIKAAAHTARCDASRPLRCATTIAITFASTPATANAHSCDFLTQKSYDSCDAIPATNRANYAHRMRLKRVRSSHVKRSGFYDACDKVENFLLCCRNRKLAR